MSIARGFLAEVRVIPMSLDLVTAFFGMTLAAGLGLNWLVAGLVLLNGFLFLYTAHLNDTLWDIMKGEYEKDRKLHGERINKSAYLARLGFGLEVPSAPLLSKNLYVSGMVFCTITGLVIAAYLTTIIGWLYLPMALLGLGLALTYSAGLDKVPALGDTMWELGVITCLFCGYYSQTGFLDMPILQLAAGLFIALFGFKMLDGWYDVSADAKISKMTLPVYMHTKWGVDLEHIRDLAYVFIYAVFALLYVQLPRVFYVGLTAGLVLELFSHFYFRGRDMEARLGITIAGAGLMAFLVWAVIVTLGLVPMNLLG